MEVSLRPVAVVEKAETGVHPPHMMEAVAKMCWGFILYTCPLVAIILLSRDQFIQRTVVVVCYCSEEIRKTL
jgi:hypothetical protein